MLHQTSYPREAVGKTRNLRNDLKNVTNRNMAAARVGLLALTSHFLAHHDLDNMTLFLFTLELKALLFIISLPRVYTTCL